MLLEREGRIVTRRGNQGRLWPADTIVDFDRSINATIKTLRRDLGIPAENPRYIETLARRGYRLMVRYRPEVSARTALEKDPERHEQSAAAIARTRRKFSGRQTLTRGKLRSCLRLPSFWPARAIFRGGTLGLRDRQVKQDHARSIAV